MALAQNPSIAALSNLVLYYDAANVKSFPGAGTTCNDISGNNNNGTMTNGPLWGGTNNGVISFDGTNDYITCGVSSSINAASSAFTWSCWFKSNSISTEQLLFSTVNASGTTGFQIEVYTSKILLQVYPAGTYAFANTTLSSNIWYHLSVTYNSGSIVYYLNGVADGTTSRTFTAATGPTYISSWAYSSAYYINGYISQVMFYNTALTAAQVLQNYNASRGRFVGTLPFAPTDISGLSLWFDADDSRTLFSNTSGTTRATTDATTLALWSDKSGNGRNAYQATGANQPLLKTTVQNNRNVVRFDGSNDSLATAAAQVANTTDGSFTAFAVAQKTTTSGSLCVLNQDNDTATRCSQFLNFGSNSNVETIGFVGGVAKSAYTLSGTISASNFYLIESVGNTSTISAYSNGVVGSGAVTGGNLAVPSQTVSLGSYQGAGTQYLNGDIAEVLLYNSALSSTNRIKVEQYLQNKWGVNTSFLPTQISGLTLWLDANDSGSLYQVSNGTNPALNNNDFIGLWKDKSGNSNNATQSTASLRPYVVASGQNSKNIIRFPYAAWNAATGPYMNATIGSLSAYSVFIICKFRTNELYSMVLTGGSNQFEVRNYSTTGYIEWNIAGGYFPRDTVSNVGSYILIELTRSGSDYTLYKNGISVGTSNNASSLNIGSTIFISSRSGNSYYFDGDMAEIIIYNSAITTAQRQQVEAYLNQKWGVF